MSNFQKYEKKEFQNEVKIKNVKILYHDKKLFTLNVEPLFNKNFQHFFYTHLIYKSNLYNEEDLYEIQTY